VAREKNLPEQHDPTLGPAVHAVHVGGESIVDRLLPHAKKIGLALLGAALLVSADYFYRYLQLGKAQRSTTSLVKALEVSDRRVFDPDPSVPQPPLDEEVFKSEAERLAAVQAAMAKVGQNRDAASLVEAQLLLRNGKLDEAIAIYQRKAKGSGIDALIAREGLGIAYETQASAAKDPTARQKLLEDSLAAFRSIQPDDKGPRRDYSLYHEARILEALGKPAEAKAALQKALEVVPESTLEQVIKVRLSSLGGA
jgi:tetratricopeptide (TPR) repeat protein